MAYENFRLDNGIEVYLDPKPLEESAVYLGFKSGSANERKIEVAHTLEHLQGIAAHIYGGDSVLRYANANAKTGMGLSSYFFSCILPEDLPLALQCLQKVFDNPDASILEREKAAVRNELQPQHNPSTSFYDGLLKILFPNHSQIITPMESRLASLGDLTIEDCIEFWETHYNPSNMILYVGGKIPENLDLKQFERFKDKVKSEKGNVEWPEEEPKLKARMQAEANLRQNKLFGLSLMYQAPVLNNENGSNLDQITANNILKNHLKAHWGPLIRILRDELRLCYSLDVRYNRLGSSNAAYLDFSVLTDSRDNFPIIEREWLKVIGEIAEKGIEEDNLEDIKKAKLISEMHDAQHFDLDGVITEALDGITNEDIQESIKETSVEGVRKIAERYAHDNYIVAVENPISDNPTKN